MAPARRAVPARGAGAFEVSLPCAYCGDEVAMSWPPATSSRKGGATPARLIARCRTCREVAYFIARGDDGVCRVHPCGPGPYADWPIDAWRPAPKNDGGAVYGQKSRYQQDRWGFSPSGCLGPAPAEPRIDHRSSRPASAPRLGGGGGRRASSSERAPAARNVGFIDGVGEQAFNGGYAHGAYGAYGRAQPPRSSPVTELIESFAAALHAKFLDAADAFAAFDTNRTGMISLTELQAGAESIGFKGDTPTIFWELDVSRRGVLSWNEFSALWRYAHQLQPLARPLSPTPCRRDVQPSRRHWSPPRQREVPPPQLPAPSPVPPALVDLKDFDGYYDFHVMPPAGTPVDYETRSRHRRGGIASQRFRECQRGNGVAAALDSWGEWRNWQESDDLGRSYEYVKDRRDRRAWEI